MSKPKNRSGPSLTASERRTNGLELLQGLWLPAKLLARLDAYVGREGTSRTEVTRSLLQSMLDRDDAAWAELRRQQVAHQERILEDAERE